MGRGLHKFLEVNTRYDIWIDRMIEYGLTSEIDYVRKSTQSEKLRGGTVKDHILTLDMAKEISMIQRTDKGKQA